MKFSRLILSCLCVLLCQKTFAVPSRPNVLFIPVEDLKPALGCYSEKEEIIGDAEANAMLVRPDRAPWDAELKALLA